MGERGENFNGKHWVNLRLKLGEWNSECTNLSLTHFYPDFFSSFFVS